MNSVRPKLKPAIPKVVTGWNTQTGRTVYLTAQEDWSEDIADAAVFTGDAADHALTFAEEDQTRVNDPYVTEVDENGQIAGREVLRETIRAKGPTIHPDLGKQAGNA